MHGFMPTSHQVRRGHVVFYVTNRIQFVHGLTSWQNIRIVSTDLHHPNCWCSKTSHAITEGNFSSNNNDKKIYTLQRHWSVPYLYNIYYLHSHQIEFCTQEYLVLLTILDLNPYLLGVHSKWIINEKYYLIVKYYANLTS